MVVSFSPHISYLAHTKLMPSKSIAKKDASRRNSKEKTLKFAFSHEISCFLLSASIRHVMPCNRHNGGSCAAA